MKLIYLDNNSTTRLLPEVWEIIRTYALDRYGNPSSPHWFGALQKRALNEARENIARILKLKTEKQIIFTSGGTESNFLAIVGTAIKFSSRKKHIIISEIEHKSVIETANFLKKHMGFDISYARVNKDGVVDLNHLSDLIRDDTALVSVMLANNETGAIQPLKEIAKLCSEKGIVLHTDAVQALGKTYLDLEALNVDLASFSAHKFHGPRGVGFLYVKDPNKIEPIVKGSHEFGLRAGTENVPSIMAMAKAMEIYLDEIDINIKKMQMLRDYMEEKILNKISDVIINAKNAPRVCNTSNISFMNVEGASIAAYLSEKGICVSTGSACTTGSETPSHVLTAMKVPKEYIKGTIRVSLSKFTTQEEIEFFVNSLSETVNKLRDFSLI